MKKVVIWGAPGTGKTSTCMKMAKEFVDDGKKVHYETFRRFMARDALKRMNEEGISNDMIEVKTTHATCYALLGLKRDMVARPGDFVAYCRREGVPVIVSEIQDLMNSEMDRDPREAAKSIGGQLYIIYQNCINMNIDVRDFMALPWYMRPPVVSKLPSNVIVRVLEGWEKYQEEKGIYDFPRMLKVCLEENLFPEVDVLISDEFHDKTPIQYELFKLWSRWTDVTVVAGDPNQAIYSFWGTDPGFFLREWEVADEKMVLKRSWRVGEEAAKVAKKVLEYTFNKMPPSDVSWSGETKVAVRPWSAVVRSLDKMIAGGTVMILARTRFHLERIASELESMGYVWSGYREVSRAELSVYEAILDIRNYTNINAEGLMILVDAYPKEFFTKSKKEVRDEIFKVIKSGERSMSVRKAYELMPRMINFIRSNPDPFALALPSWKSTNSRLIERVKRLLKTGIRNDPSRLMLLTIHGSKGLEADYVILIDGVTQAVMEDIRTSREMFMNEGRVWYVAMTRARRKLIVVPTNTYRVNFKNKPFVGWVLI